MAGNRAPSCSLLFEDNLKGDIIINHVFVPAGGTGVGTYYCALQWNAGRNGGGYCGIQDHPDGRCFIFSLWDPMTTSEPIEAVVQHPGTKVERFGGEGTGLKSMNFSIGWEENKWYSLVVKRWDYNGHTRFGFWVHRFASPQGWFHLVTMDFPVPDVTFETQTACFIEDWMGTGEKMRRVLYDHGYKKKLDGTWFPLNKCVFNVVQEDACKMYNDNYDGGIETKCFYMQTGGKTVPSEVLATDRFMTKGEVSNEPSLWYISFDVLDANKTRVIWKLDRKSVPQFRYRVYVNDELVEEGIDYDKRECTYKKAKPGSIVKVYLEDILGKNSTIPFDISGGNEIWCCGRRLL